MRAVLPWLLVAFAWTAHAQEVSVLVNANVVPMDREVVLSDHVVVVRGERIEAVLPRERWVVSGEEKIIDLERAWVLPGLADMHTHLRFDPANCFRLFLANGVTTIRNMDYLDGGYDHVELRRQIAEGELLGPRYLVSGPVLSPSWLPDVPSVEPLLRKHVERGMDYVKVHADLDPEVYEALLEGAAKLDLTVVGHAQRRRGLGQTLRMYSVSHAEEFLYVLGREALADDARRAAIADSIAASGVYVSPTLLVYDTILDYVLDDRFGRLGERGELAYLPPAERELWLSAVDNEYRAQDFSEERIERTRWGSELLAKLTFDMHRAGVRLILGSDAFGVLVPGFSAHEELAKLVAVGLTPYQALRTGTVDVAEYLCEPGNGIVAPGAIADLVVVGGDPLLDIRCTRDLHGVMVRGRWISPVKREEMLRDVQNDYATC